MANRVVHFEIEARDLARAKKFYTDAFDWEMKQSGEEMGNYVTVKTGDPQEPGGINGGIFPRPNEGYEDINAFSCVIGVDDINKSMQKVKTAGGQVFGKPVDIPKVGKYVKCKDTEGNIFTLLQPEMN